MDVSPKNISDYLEQIHRFLINNEKSYIFPSLTMAMEDILANITKDTNYLKKFDDVDSRIWTKKILEVLEINKEIYTLSYCFENTTLGKKVMVYKKNPVTSETPEPAPLFKEPLGLKLLRKPHSPKEQPASTDATNTVLSSFKTTCLNATLKFVKNDKQLILQYPDICTEQADFIKNMVSQCLSPKDFSTTPGSRSIFEPLAEAFRIFSTKYDFKLNHAVPVNKDMKRLFIEKIPKKITERKDFDNYSINSGTSISTEDSVESHQYITHLIQKLDKQFKRQTVRSIKEFLLNADEETIAFNNLDITEGQFLVQWKSVLVFSEGMKLFDEDIQDDLWMIKCFLAGSKGILKIKTLLQKVNSTQRTVRLIKNWLVYFQIQVNTGNKTMLAKSTEIINENYINDSTTTNSTTKTVNSILKSKIAMPFPTFNEIMNGYTVNSIKTKDSMIINEIPITNIQVNEFDNTFNSVTKINMNLESKSLEKVNTDTIEVTASAIKVNNSLSTDKTKTDTGFNKVLNISNDNTKPFSNFHSKVEVNTKVNSFVAKANASMNSTMAERNATENSSMSKTNATENSSMSKTNATENSSMSKTNATENSSMSKTNATENSSMSKTNATENSTMAEINATENSSISKTNATENSSMSKTNATENSSMSKTNATENSTMAEINATENCSMSKTNATDNSSMSKTNATENSTTSKTNATENSSMSKTNATENSSMSKTNATENSTMAEINATENSSMSKTNATENSSMSKTNATENCSMSKTNATENSSMSKTNATENSTMAEINATENSSMSKTNATENSTMAEINATENSSMSKTNATENCSMSKTNATENSSMSKTNATENSTMAEINATENSSMSKTNATENSSMSKTNATENSSMSKTNATENCSMSKTNATDNSSMSKTNATENSTTSETNATENCSMPKTNATENSSMSKTNATENSTMAEINATENSSMAKINATENSYMDQVLTFAMKASVKSIEMNPDKNENDFVIAKTSKKNILNQCLPKEIDELSSLKTALSFANGQFIEHAITKLRNFISSKESIKTLIFTELSNAEQEIILNWQILINRSDINSMFCVRGQMVLDEIRILIENGRKIFTVTISSKTVSPSDRTVTFTKTMHKKPAAEDKAVVDLDYPDLISDCNIHISPEKMNKRIQKFFNKTKTLTDEWIEKSLKQLKNFIEDDAQARLVIQDVSNPQKTFLFKWKTFLGRKDVIEIYNADIQRLMVDIKKCLAEKMASWSITTSSSKVRKNLKRDMTFMKTPGYDDKKKTQVPTKTAPKSNINKAEIANKSNTSKNETSTKIVEPVNRTKAIPKSCSVTSLPVKKVPVSSERGRPKSASVAPSLPQAKVKLIQALSQPLVSERGLKMMKNMGWDGGALGLRGEGILEPIALHLDLKKRAGLGCEKEQTKLSKQPLTDVPVITNLSDSTIRVIPRQTSKMEFRMGVLHTILCMMQESTLSTGLQFHNKLTQKYWSFVRHSVVSFNERTKYMHNVPILRDLGLCIMEKLNESNCIITACWGISKTNILFVISKAVYQPCDADSMEWCSIVSFDKPKVPDTKSVNTHDNVVVAGEAFRYYVLAQVLEFCGRSVDTVRNKPLLSKEIVLKETLVQNEMSYVKNVIIHLNNKSRLSSDSKSETDVFNNIIEVMNGFTLDVDFPCDKCTNENKQPVYKTIRFHKIFNTPKTLKQNTTTEVTNKDMKRRTTFTSDTFDEKCMFDSQITINDQIAPIRERDDPKVVQDLKNDHDELKIHQDTSNKAQDVPKIAQNPKHEQDAPKRYTPTNLPNLLDGIDCLCCLPDNTDMEVNEEKVVEKAVEYIDKETVICDIGGPTDTVTKDNEVKSEYVIETATTIANLDEDIQNLSINDDIEHIENLVELPEETINKLCLENNEFKIHSSNRGKDLCKRPISNSTTPDRTCKKIRNQKYFKKIIITPKNYPQNEITNEIAAKIQKSILGSIDYTNELPLLQCHGIEDGVLIYSCHTEKSLDFILNVIKIPDILVTLSEEDENICHKMTVKIRTFIKETIDAIFQRLQAYNVNLDTKNWKVIDIERGRDFVIISMEVDENSYKMICREKFTLYTGIDQAKFSILWD